jgi:hypothetical protein
MRCFAVNVTPISFIAELLLFLRCALPHICSSPPNAALERLAHAT